MQRITIRRWRSILPPNRSCNLYGSSSFSPSCNSGLPQADIDVIRTGGPEVTEDVLAEIIVSNRVLGSSEILILNHTGCGFTTFTDEELNAKLSVLRLIRRRLQCASSPTRTPRKIPGSRLGRSRRIRGLPKTSPCAASFLISARADCAK